MSVYLSSIQFISNVHKLCFMSLKLKNINFFKMFVNHYNLCTSIFIYFFINYLNIDTYYLFINNNSNNSYYKSWYSSMSKLKNQANIKKKNFTKKNL